MTPETPQEPTDAPETADAPAEGDPTSDATDAPQAGADTPEAASEPELPPAESDVDRLKRELADAEAAQAKQTQADAIDAGSEPCPVCGANPPGTDEENPREIWCPHCGAKLANLPEGH